MRPLIPLVVLLALFACAAAPDKPVEPAPQPVAEAHESDGLPSKELGRCHPACCSDKVREMQEEHDDPSIAGECCFCDEPPDPVTEPGS